ncbi:MAG TPA: class 1 fructose-bisphosphatase [Methylibium sp.]|nr:class 1 fructose-bisphosphatase [Methylibium sp.]
MSACELSAWLAQRPPAVAEVVQAMAAACAGIAQAVARGANADAAERLIAAALGGCPQAAGWSSASQAEVTPSPEHACRGGFLVAFDALDEGGVSAGTLFSVLPHLFRGAPASAVAFMQPAHRQVCAGCALYGPVTRLALAGAEGVTVFALDPDRGHWTLVREAVQVSASCSEFAADTGRQRHWEKPVQRYVAECQAGEGGPRGRDFGMHWHGNLAAEVHHILAQGGVVLLPRQSRAPGPPRTIELLHHAAPVALLMERAGAAASTGTTPLIELVPDALHQRVPAILGARDEVQRIVGYHADPHENVSWQLFKTRSLFVQPNA